MSDEAASEGAVSREASQTGPRVALFGGSFNPPHLGHQCLSLMLLQSGRVDQVWWLPTYRHYFGKNLCDFDERVAMCELATASFGDRCLVSRVEAELADPQGRMLDTLDELARRHPQHRFHLVIGADILAETSRWYRWDAVEAKAPPLVFRRHGYAGGEWPAPPDISSTELRDDLRSGRDVSTRMDVGVLRYLAERGLYL